MSGCSKKKREMVLNKFDGKCAYCGCDLNLYSLNIDHFISKNSGGTLIKENCFPACCYCNSKKYDYDLETFRLILEKDILKDNVRGRAVKQHYNKFYKNNRITFYFETLKGENKNGN